MASDIWIVGQTPDGRYVVRTENDGWTFMRRGADASDEILSRKQLDHRYPGLYGRMHATRDRLAGNHR